MRLERRTTAATMQQYWQASLQHRSAMVVALFGPVGAILTNVAVPLFASRALAATVMHNGAFTQDLLALAISAILGLLANRFGVTRLFRLQAETMSELNDRVFSHLLRRGARFHSNQIGGKLISDAIDYVTSYSNLTNAIFNTALTFAAVLVSGLLIVGLQSWQLGLYLLLVVSVTVGWAYAESRTRYDLRNKRLIASKNVTAHLSDSIVNAVTVKAFAREKQEIAYENKLNGKLRDLRLTDWQRAARSGNDRIAALLLMLAVLLLLIHHLASTDKGIFGIGLFAFTYTFTLIIRLFDLNALTRQVEESFLQAAPMTEILQEAVEIEDTADARPLQISAGSIDFDRVHFRYEDDAGNKPVFGSLELSIKAGEKIGLVGPSGSGKTTLTRLLLRFEDIQTGHILIDGQDIAKVTQMSLRQAISYVPQEPLLFHRSIADNIAYGKSGATKEEVIVAARKAYAHNFISQLSQGYDTIVGERGVKLSGGQRQRVAIARAMLKNAPLLVLDEATSALDSESEKVIQEALWNLMRDRTAIVVAHRLSTIQKMDRIIVLDQGKIVEEGSHKSLLKQNGLYAKLWAHQSGGFIEE